MQIQLAKCSTDATDAFKNFFSMGMKFRKNRDSAIAK